MGANDGRQICIGSYEAFVAFLGDTVAERERMAAYEASLPNGERFFHRGVSVLCARSRSISWSIISTAPHCPMAGESLTGANGWSVRRAA